MINVLYGFLGALILAVLFGIAFFMGWKACERLSGAHIAGTKTAAASPLAKVPLTEEKQDEAKQDEAKKYRQEMEAEQAAFRKMMGYNMETALGLNDALDEKE